MADQRQNAGSALDQFFVRRGYRIRRHASVGGPNGVIEVESPGGSGSGGDLAGRWFVKSIENQAGGEESQRRLAAEMEGLDALEAVGVLSVPADRYLVAGSLILRAVEGSPRPGFFEAFGRDLALHHRASQEDRFGFTADNYLGASLQPNRWSSDWVEFFASRRLGFQLGLARRRGNSTPELERLGDRLLERLAEWLTVDEPASLLHGDLWSGNFLAGSDGRAVVIDPAVHYGHRECDLAMARLFGGFSEAFFRSYDEVWPLGGGAEERNQLYQLYHRLNHLNLFGQGYLAGCLDCLRRFVG